MLSTTTETDRNLLEAVFYEKSFQFSYSSLSTLLTAPGAFYKDYILMAKDEFRPKHLLSGTLIHYLLLENFGFDEKFLMANENLPSDNTLKCVIHIFEECYSKQDDPDKTLDCFEQEILDYLVSVNLHQSLKDTKDGTGDDKRIAKIVDQTSSEYFEYLKTKGNRTIIDANLLEHASYRADVVKNNEKIRALLGMDLTSDGVNHGVYNELKIDIPKEALNLPFGIKGILDNMVVYVKDKKVVINDFKTTSKTLSEFESSVEFWKYWLQGAVYKTLARYFLRTILTPDWTIEFNFVVFDKYDQLYAFPVSNETMEIWLDKYRHCIKQATYHYESKDYTLPYDFAHNLVKL